MNPPVTSLTYFLTEACNLRCTYCYVDKNSKRSDEEVGRAVIDFLIRESHCETSLHLRFFGGEPLLEIALIERLVRYGRHRANEAKKRIEFDMISNGTLADEEVVGRLKELGVTVMVSIDGTRKTMEQNRPFFVVREGFDGFDQKVRHLAATGVGRVARMTISPGQQRIGSDLQQILDLGYSSILMSTATNLKWDEIDLARIYGEMADFYIDNARDGRIVPLKVTNEFLLARHEIERGTHRPPQEGFCAAGKQMLGVSVAGDLYPCHRFVQLGAQFRLGTVFDGIQQADRSFYAEVDTPALHHDVCQSCHALPYCSGSCMAANLPATGELLYPEERHCLDLRAHVDAVHRIYHQLMLEECAGFIDFIEREWRSKRRQLLLSVLGREQLREA